MSKEDKKPEKKDNNNPLKQFNFKFNFYWIYGVIFALILGYQFLNSADIVNSKLTENEFNEILNENDFSKIVIVNGDYAQLFLKSEALDKEKHSKNKNPSIFNAASPTYTYDFGDLQNFENKLNIHIFVKRNKHLKRNERGKIFC